MSITLPALPYALDALEPHLSRHTLAAHPHPRFGERSGQDARVELLPASARAGRPTAPQPGCDTVAQHAVAERGFPQLRGLRGK